MMNRNRTYYIIALLTIMFQWPIMLYAQKVVTVEGDYDYWASPSMSPLEAKTEAVKNARIEALANQFGRIISSNSFLGMDHVDGEEHTSFNQIGESEVRGEWISDLEEPKVVKYLSQDDLSAWITVHVKGKAREIVSAPVQFETKILKNGTEDNYESDDFKINDKLYMSFRTPVNGYLAIYMIDDEGNAFRLIPYQNSDTPSFPVERDKKYFLFTMNDGGNGIKAICQHPVEFNHLYTIFSPNKFTRPLDNGTSTMDDGKTILPPQLSLADFQKWFVNIRKHDKEMTVDRRTIRVKK